MEYGTLRLRWDNESSWFLTVIEPVKNPGKSNFGGMCGDFDGFPGDDLTINGEPVEANEFGNSWSVFMGDDAVSI